MSASAHTAVEGCLDVCHRCRLLVAEVRRHPSRAARAYRRLGPHLRHCLDHVTALLRGLETGTVDYDARDREAAVERDPEAFLAALADAEAGLRGVTDVDRQLQVLQQAAPQTPSPPLTSSLGRELAFVSSHTVHHLALMVQLAAAEGIDVPDELGVAFSTATWRSHQTAARS